MARMKTFLIYALIIVGFYIFSEFMINVGLNSTYRSINRKDNIGQVNIYQAEATSSGLGKYAASSSSEYFAEAFKIYFQDPGRLQKDAPLTYQYVENICTLLSGIDLNPAV